VNPAPVSTIVAALDSIRDPDRRLIVAIAGAPGSGKSTLSEAARDALNAREKGVAEILPMDGYHLDNAILDARGWRSRKSAPHTFDVAAFARDLARARAADEPMFAPVFDRGLDLSRGSAREIAPACRVVIVEGNYLLIDEAPWNRLADLFDYRVFLSVPETVLETRLVQRWRDHGFSSDKARAKALGNDIPNARYVVSHSVGADLVIGTDA
jgi:pantothenate kinase